MSTPPDSRSAFWREWHTIHRKLSSWTLPTHQTITPEVQRISLAFQSAALLYTVRLASPHLPTTHPQFQDLVHNALGHIAYIGWGSNVLKFLLWPLFIVGTECVEENDRDVVRVRCMEIMRESGFFNNLKTLEVLERVWAEDDREAAQAAEKRRCGLMFESPVTIFCGAEHKQAFRWRKVMNRTDGEYIVV